MKTFCQAGIVFLYFALVAGFCPSNRSITPCACKQLEDLTSLHCKGPQDSERIVSVIRKLRIPQKWELVLESLTLPVLPPSVRDVNSLRFFDVRIEKLQNSFATWPKLDEVVIESCTLLGNNPWAYFRGAQSLRHLKLTDVAIPTIGSEFKENVPSGIEYLEIRKTGTSFLESGAMSAMRKLKLLTMVDMPLREFPRDALPAGMPNLSTFILGNTDIETLEAGFFEGMPKLDVLILNGNKLTTLDSLLFAPVQDHLTHLVAGRNPLICDCNLLWLTKSIEKKESINVLATCKDDATQTWKEVASLNKSEYC